MNKLPTSRHENASQITTEHFVHPHPLKTAVLFLAFNRPDTTKQVFEAIRKAKPPRLYVAADGPRADKAGEAEKVKQVRRIATQVDWDCEVKTLFRDKNLGCGKAVSSAITWFFENEEEGIILEDDCLPGQSFFWFCEELLERYRGDMRVWHIGGYKHFGLGRDKFSYNFSFYTPIWGWATWRRAWKYYDLNLTNYQIFRNWLGSYNLFSSQKEINRRKTILDKVCSGSIDTWDYQWNFCVRSNSGLSIRPSRNLVENIGFGNNATHTISKNKGINSAVKYELEFPLMHPNLFWVNAKLDQNFFNTHVSNSIAKRIIMRLSNLFNRS
ncbi:MAG: hypothetical protein LWX54_04150 [Deltaproteobacteria bacterium]|nr:hypothetical protein [Deltaproteobacteria bacterium]